LESPVILDSLDLNTVQIEAITTIYSYETI
jgi:hypothetical protein